MKTKTDITRYIVVFNPEENRAYVFPMRSNFITKEAWKDFASLVDHRGEGSKIELHGVEMEG